MSQAKKEDNLKYVMHEIVKDFIKTPGPYNPLEQDFIKTVSLVVEAGTSVNKKQLFNIYKIYYQHIEQDPDEFEDWCYEKGFKAEFEQMQINRDRYRDKGQR